MPAKSAKQYGLMQAAAHGNLKSMGGPSTSVAKEFINKTPAKKRSTFTAALKKKTKKKDGSGMMRLLNEAAPGR